MSIQPPRRHSERSEESLLLLHRAEIDRSRPSLPYLDRSVHQPRHSERSEESLFLFPQRQPFTLGEVEPSERPVATRTRLPRAHPIHSTWADRWNRGLGQAQRIRGTPPLHHPAGSAG